MDENPTAPATAPDHRSPSAAASAAPVPAAQPALFAAPLPFDDEADEPIAYALTGRARRHLAPDEVPALVVVEPPAWSSTDRSRPPDDAATLAEDPTDTRPARARALRRAGVAAADIARQLDTDPVLIRAWVGEVAPAPGAGRLAAVRPAA
ncbi:MAG: hypothetical protein JJT89_16885, partial [Nitriliruptoraceae bacterium]|nr:hypothetical protein [Nitriliruptoraceae bacterium]